jgi:uncharacterized membrane protein YidH (DUF202 family)
VRDVSTPPVEHDSDDQVERTLLSWRRTALSLLATGLLVAHLAARGVGTGLLLTTLLGTSAVVAFVWLGHQRQLAVTGLALVVGIALLGVVALLGVTGG